ncbi:MAG: PKD domain-containing protein, partial [Acidobacteria bacterium]|nr:PKD domain-containing protein [Acidobacteriota bacterium]
MCYRVWQSMPLFLLLVLGSAHAAAWPQRGVVNGLAVTPKLAKTGTTISATATGINPCGAVFIDWGDGTAITYAIVDLPSTQTHSYTHGGDYTVRARGMGNCDGDVTASIRIDGPPPPPPAAQPRLTGFTVASPAGRGDPVNMRMEGQGSCHVSVAFGDGNTQEFSVQLPHTFTHVYSVARGYNVTASAAPPC